MKVIENDTNSSFSMNSEYIQLRGFGYERIDGNVTGLDRQKRVDSFNAPDAKQFIFLLRFSLWIVLRLPK